MFKAVVFDIDGTLTRDISWNRFTLGLGGSVETHNEIYGRWKKGEMTLKESNKLCLVNWSKENKANKNDIRSILEKIPLRHDAVETVKYLKQKGYEICMITGSFDMYAQMVGEELGIIEHYSISKLIWDENDSLIDVETVADDKAAKVELFYEFCKKYNLEPKDCVPVGDSSNDINLFKITGNGIAVRTEFEAKELESVAWKVVEELGDIKSIL